MPQNGLGRNRNLFICGAYLDFLRNSAPHYFFKLFHKDSV